MARGRRSVSRASGSLRANTAVPREPKSTRLARWDPYTGRYRCRFGEKDGEPCGKPYANSRSINTHWRNKHDDTNGPYRELCSSCDLLASDIYSHKSVHKPNPAKKQSQCKMCWVAWYSIAEREHGQAKALTIHQTAFCPVRKERPVDARKWDPTQKKFEEPDRPSESSAPFDEFERNPSPHPSESPLEAQHQPLDGVDRLLDGTHERPCYTDLESRIVSQDSDHPAFSSESSSLAPSLPAHYRFPDTPLYGDTPRHFSTPYQILSNPHQQHPSFIPPRELEWFPNYPFSSDSIANRNLGFPYSPHYTPPSRRAAGPSTGGFPVPCASQSDSAQLHQGGTSPFAPIHRRHPYAPHLASDQCSHQAPQVFTSVYNSDHPIPPHFDPSFFDYNNPHPPPSHSIRKVLLTRRQALRYG